MASRTELPVKLYYRIGEVAEIVGVEPHVLRYWESEFGTIRPQKSPKGQRVYSRRDLEKLLRVKELLYDEGYTIAGAKKRLREAPTASAASSANASSSNASLTNAASSANAAAASPRVLEPVTTTPPEYDADHDATVEPTLAPRASSPVGLSSAAVSPPNEPSFAAPVKPSELAPRPAREAWRISAAGARTPNARPSEISASAFSAALSTPPHVAAPNAAAPNTAAANASAANAAASSESASKLTPPAAVAPIGVPSAVQPTRSASAASLSVPTPNSPAIVSQAILAAARADATRAESRWSQARGEIRELRDSLRAELTRIDAVGFELDDVELGAEGFERYDASGFDPSGFARGD